MNCSNMSKSGLPVNDIFMLKILLLTGSLISQSCLEFTSPRIGIMYIIWDSHHPHRKRLKGHLDINGFREDVAACRDLQDVLMGAGFFFSIWDTFPRYLLHFEANMLKFGTEIYNLHCSSVCPRFPSIFPWCSLIVPLFYSMFHGFTRFVHGFH